ncbi:MAG TPA: YbhB/YbcL family Raf kinase inhibitor-like protein [Sedimentisphaerales bacterium]|nr:YbhB/YbcL family Raf kinase inhibitor-like protein [Sedimentisphaerales bacterium]HRS12298.1 YbhB/YbcL family Raf kinase inhibitor-like protein [Sedimentisphaerales bacterium]HRV50010.1 YbhB/YbcL family Raf kinase inhibitor-like protein [Sedimentisphaerales bacterium]
MLRILLPITALAVTICGCEKHRQPVEVREERSRNMTISVSSPAFQEGGMIPAKYTCDGDDLSPPLQWAEVPEAAKSIALICDDPDAPVGTWVHWVMWNIPPSVADLTEGVPPQPELPDGSRQGISDFGRPGYGGPCPPSGTHRYYFTVYALDAMLDLPASTRKADLIKAMKGHILAEGQLMGRYRRR